MRLIIVDNVIRGYTVDQDFMGNSEVSLIDVPEGFNVEELSDFDLVDGAVVLNAARALVRSKGKRLAQLGADYEAAITSLRADYPASETLTWNLQLTEARAYQAWLDGGKEGAAPAIPFLSALSAGRDAAGVGDGLEDLVSRVIANDALYTPAVAKLTALRHAADLEVQTAPNTEALAAVTWSFLP